MLLKRQLDLFGSSVDGLWPAVFEVVIYETILPLVEWPDRLLLFLSYLRLILGVSSITLLFVEELSITSLILTELSNINCAVPSKP